MSFIIIIINNFLNNKMGKVTLIGIKFKSLLYRCINLSHIFLIQCPTNASYVYHYHQSFFANSIWGKLTLISSDVKSITL